MEAKMQYDFKASQADELSCKKGDIIKVIDTSDPDWFQSEKNGKLGFVPSSYMEIKPHRWYCGEITRSEAERKLMKTQYPDGIFLVRKSTTAANAFSLSVKQGEGVQHFKILSDSSGNYYIWSKIFRSVNELIENHKKETITRSANTTLLLIETEFATCAYGFQASQEDELSFKKGEVLEITDKSDPEWYNAVNSEGQSGLVPANYVKIH